MVDRVGPGEFGARWALDETMRAVWRRRSVLGALLLARVLLYATSGFLFGDTRLEFLLWGIVTSLIDAYLVAAITLVALNDRAGYRITAATALNQTVVLIGPVMVLQFVTAIGVGLASLLLIVPGVLLALRWAVAVPVRVAEGGSVAAALRRSGELSIGWRPELFALALLYTVVMVAVVVALRLLGHGLDPVVALLLGSLVNAAAWTFLAVGTAVCYVGLRVARGELAAPPDGVTIPLPSAAA